MIDSLTRGKLDAVIATQQIDSANIDYMMIDQEEFCLVASTEVNWSQKLSKNTNQKNYLQDFLLEQQWVSYSSELPIIRRFWQVVFKRRPNIEPVMVIPSLLLIRKAVEYGLGVSVLPRYLCQESLNAGNLTILWEPNEPMTNNLWVATRKIDRNKPEIEQLITTLRCN